MVAYALRRLSHALPVLLVVSLITFALIHLVPGDAAQVIAGPDATRAQVAGVRTALGLDQPLYTQLVLWYGACCTAISATPTCLGGPCCKRSGSAYL